MATALAPVVLAVALAVGSTACGAKTGLDVGEDRGAAPPSKPGSSAESPQPPLDCAGAPGPLPATTCGPLRMNISVEAACDIVRPGCAPVDAEGFVSVPACECGVPDLGSRFPLTVLPFVRDHGKGLLAVADYVCSEWEPPPAFGEMNEVTIRAGFTFAPTHLAYGDGSVELPCVADYAPVSR